MAKTGKKGKKARPSRSKADEGSRAERSGRVPLLIGWLLVVLVPAAALGWSGWDNRPLPAPGTSATLPVQPSPIAAPVGSGEPGDAGHAPPGAAADAAGPPSSDATSESGQEPTKTAAATKLTLRPELPPPPALPSAARAAVRLAPVPDPALVIETEKGPLPVIGPDGRQPWQVYARPFQAAEGVPRIAVVVGDMGLSAPATNTAIQQLPGAITLAFAPYAANLQDWIGKARAAGHEVMLQLPMEPNEYPTNDPGPNALLTTLSPGANLDRLEWLLGRFAGYTGVTNYMGSKFTTSAKSIRPVMAALKSRGLMFIDARTTERSVAGRIARDLGVPVAINNRYIDNQASRRNIDRRLGELERIAKSSGAALGLAFPYPVTIERLANWSVDLERRGIRLAPASAIVDRQAAK